MFSWRNVLICYSAGHHTVYVRLTLLAKSRSETEPQTGCSLSLRIVPINEPKVVMTLSELKNGTFSVEDAPISTVD